MMRLRNNIVKLLKLLTLLFMLKLSSAALAVDIDRLFPQIIDNAFFIDLQSKPGNDRAIFVDLAGTEKVFYLRYHDKNYILHTNLNENEESLLDPVIFAGKTDLFSPTKQNKEALYRKGHAFNSKVLSKSGAEHHLQYVPHRFAGTANNAFISDLGYLHLTVATTQLNKKSELASIFAQLFGKNARICEQVRLNRYYLFRDNYYGPVEFIKDRTSDRLIFLPVHKATLNKSVSDWQEKAEKDRTLTIDLIAREKFLFSQDMRLKLGMVPGFVKINWQYIDNTDIGSGQNHLVFLSSGAGINYFDDPWQQARKNLPCPRLYFHRDLCNLERVQLYPTYSI